MLGEVGKKRLLDLVFLGIVGAVGVGVFYLFVMIQGHREFDKALVEVIKAATAKQQQQAQDAAPATP